MHKENTTGDVKKNFKGILLECNLNVLIGYEPESKYNFNQEILGLTVKMKQRFKKMHQGS